MGGPSFRGIRKEMRILLTGSSGWLGQTLVPRLSDQGHQVIGLDPIPSDHTQIVGSVTLMLRAYPESRQNLPCLRERSPARKVSPMRIQPTSLAVC
jgi:NAD(P)-dependent dehydrogenase (short-subunit alcohol dehydrogenase family)